MNWRSGGRLRRGRWQLKRGGRQLRKVGSVRGEVDRDQQDEGGDLRNDQNNGE
jgi:hypothetical protein